MTTFWLDLKGDSARSQSSGSGSSVSEDSAGGKDDEGMFMTDMTKFDEALGEKIKAQPLNDKNMRLVNWNTEILSRLLREIVARRDESGVQATDPEVLGKLESHHHDNNDTIVLEEMIDVISLPTFDAVAVLKQKDPSSIVLGPQVVDQLHDYIQTIAALYRSNPFHNFEHASHVTMSVVKLLSRIVAPELQSNNADHAAKDLVSQKPCRLDVMLNLLDVSSNILSVPTARSHIRNHKRPSYTVQCHIVGFATRRRSLRR
jgi:hypothetical protein